MRYSLIIIFLNFIFFSIYSISAENNIYKKIDLFGEVLEKIWSELIPKEKVMI